MDKNSKPPQEFFDLPLNLYGWNDDKENYRIVAELIPKSQDISELIETLNEVNRLLATKNTKHIFDGTIDSLKYFVDNHYLDINLIQNPVLKEILEKHLYDPKASQNIIMNSNRWSGQALMCKAVLVGLYIRNGKLYFTREQADKDESLTKLSEFDFPVLDGDIESGRVSEVSIARLTSLNATWITLSQINPWSQHKTRGIDKMVIENMVSSHFKNSSYNQLFEQLQPYIESVANTYFPGFHKTDHRACVAIRHAAFIVLYRTLEFMPKDAVRHPQIRIDGFLNKWAEYIFTPEYELQPWFIKYLTEEMDKRIKFLKMLADENIYMEVDPEVENTMRGILKEKYRPPQKQQLYYLPVFESFRFVPPGSISLFSKLVSIFYNRNIPTSNKEEIAKTVVFNIQKLVSETITSANSKNQDDREYLMDKPKKEAFMMLVLNILIPLARSTVANQKDSMTHTNSDIQDLKQIVTTEILSSILKYDSSRNRSFFGYIKAMLPFNVKSAVRERKSEQVSSSLENIVESKPNLFTSLDNFESDVDIIELQKKVSECLDTLPEKEKIAIKKAYFQNERLNDTERKAKNRAFQRLKKSYPELIDLIP